jgi:hypothetical protein
MCVLMFKMPEAICILIMHAHTSRSESKSIVFYNNSSCFKVIHIKMNLINSQYGVIDCICSYVRAL